MKILHFVPGIGMGGIERFIMDLTSHTSEEFKHDFFVFGRGESEFLTYIKKKGNVYITRGWSYSTLKVLSKVLKDNKYDIIHAHLGCWAFIVLIIAKLRGVKKRIAHSHSADGFKDMNLIGKVIYIFSRVLNPLCVTHYLACSNHACERTYGFKVRNGKRYVRVINPVDIKRFVDVSDELIIKTRESLNLRENRKIICNVGYLGRHKNQIFLLQMASELDIEGIDLVIVGDGWNRKQLENYINDNAITNVTMLGNRNDIPELLHIADVFVLPSILEGLGTVVLEAQACGTPCIISECVTMETDMGLGLVKQIELGNKDDWKKSIIQCKQLNVLTTKEIESAFAQNCADVLSCVELVEKIYSWEFLQ